MTFNPAIPLAANSPSIFPTQSQTNFTRLQTIVSADHQFNLTASANDGWHNIVHLTQQSPAPAPVAATGRLYSKVSGGQTELFYMDDTAVASLNFQITPTMPIRAAVNFNGTGAVGAQTIRGGYNVASVMKTSTGVYTVNFTTPMPGTDPNANYIVQVTGMSQGTAIASILIGAVLGNTVPNYQVSVSVAFVKIYFVTLSGALSDPTMGNVTIFSVT